MYSLKKGYQEPKSKVVDENALLEVIEEEGTPQEEEIFVTCLLKATKHQNITFPNLDQRIS